MSNQANFAPFLSILIANINKNGTCNDAEVCKEIAQYINSNPIYFGSTLYDFIYEHGEDAVETYGGRDEDGEKVYHTYNPDTNWHERIRKELVTLGFFENRVIEFVSAIDN